MQRRRFICGGASLGLLGLAGCASQTRALLASVPEGLPRRAELAETPFFPQDRRFLCGPEALAAVLRAAGLYTTPAGLEPQVYLPGRQGSLQIEMLAAARRAGAVAVVLPPELMALCREIAAGTPVVILQNLGLAAAPTWHYAVVVGYDLDESQLILRSGPERRQLMPISTFEHTWARSERWAFVAMPAGRWPVTGTESEVIRAAVAFERVAPPAQAAKAYEAALARWDGNLTLAMGLGNSRYASGRKKEAAEVFRAAAQKHRHAAAWINLGAVELELGRLSDARAAAREALALGGPWEQQARALQQRIEAQRR